MQKADYPTALNFDLKALKIAITNHLKVNSAIAYNQIGLVHYYIDDYSKAINHFLKAKDLLQNVSFNILKESIMGNLARAYLKRALLDSALFFGY